MSAHPESLEPFDAHAVTLGGLELEWARGLPRRPFEHAQFWGHRRLRWNRDATRLWIEARGGWVAWDAITGAWLRRARSPDDLELPELDPDQLAQLQRPGPDGTTREVVAVSADRRRVVRCVRTPHGAPRLVLCDVDGAEIVVLQVVGDRRPVVAFSATSDRVVSCAPAGLVIHAASDGRCIAEIPADGLDRLSHVAWPRGSALVVALGRPKAMVRCLDCDTGRLRWEQPVAVRDLQASLDGQRIAIRTTDHELRVHEVATGAAVPVERPRGPVLCGEPDTVALVAQLARHPVILRSARDHVDGMRAFGGGTRAEVVVSRGIERAGGVSWVKCTSTIETSTGVAVDGRAPWRVSEEAIARATSALAVPAAASLRAVSSDGRLMFFVLGRDPRESWDPDAGPLTSYEVTMGLWDDVASAWRWEIASSLAGLGVGSWLLEQASFEFTFDETGIIGRGSSAESSQAHSIADGTPRWLAPSDRMPRPASVGDGTVLAADRAAARAVVVRSTRVELWDLAADGVIGWLDLAPIDDAATAAALVTAPGGFVLGTELGRILRFSPSRR